MIVAVGGRSLGRAPVSSEAISPSNSGNGSIAWISTCSMAPPMLNMSSRPIGANEMFEVMS